ncbi:MAG: protease pro-enzyme activation domain-containing protein, partial [Lysobacterales bacterium]
MNGMCCFMQALHAGAAVPRRSLFTAACVIVLALSSVSHAVAADAIVTPVDNAKRAILTDHGPAWAQPKNDRGAVPADLALDHLSLILRRSPERQAAYDRLLREQQDPASPSYHRWLSPVEVGERFGAGRHDIAVLSDWLRTQGFSITAVANSRIRIDFSGRAADVGAAFATELHYFQAGAAKRIANTSEPSMPAALAGSVRSVFGLNSPKLHRKLRTELRRESMDPQPTATNCQTTPCSHAIFPADFRQIYDLDSAHWSSVDGSGQTIAVLGRTRVYEPDVMNFQQLAGLATKYPVVIVPPDGTDPGAPASTCSETGTPSCSHPTDAVKDQGEATLDVERAGSVAPGATIKLIVSGEKNSVDGVFIAMNYAIDTNPVPAKIISISYGSCEADATQSDANYLDDAFGQAAMEGISVFVASGDGGAADCDGLDATPSGTERLSADLLCASSHVTCVGGTEFADTTNPDQYWSRSNAFGYQSALGYIPEGAWNDPLNADGTTTIAATGGGVSRFTPTPPWQNGVGVPGTQGRYSPDVALAASTREGYFTCTAAQGGSCVISNGSFHFLAGGGTSASTPSMAGIAALLNHVFGGPQGNLNPTLYSLASNPANGVFHDVTVASSGVTNCTLATPSLCNNSTPGPHGLSGGLHGYAVTSGYDLATGLGSIDVGNLLTRWGEPPGVNLDQHGLSGSWANPATAGQGLLMDIEPDFYGSGTGLLFGGWFTYDTNVAGGRRWYTIQTVVRDGYLTEQSQIYLTQGGAFDSSLATDTSAVGNATLHFSDCMHGTLQYTFS